MQTLLFRNRILIIEIAVAIAYIGAFVTHEARDGGPVGIVALAMSATAIAVHRIRPAVALALVGVQAIGLLLVGFDGRTPTLEIWAAVPIVLFSAAYFGGRATRWVAVLSGMLAWVAITIQSALFAFGGAWAFRDAAYWVVYFSPTAIGSALALIAAPIIGVVLRLRFSRRSNDPGASESFDTFARRIGLTPRELQIFRLAVDGLSNSEIATTEHVTEATVKSQMTRVLAKTGTHDRAELAQLARARGLTESTAAAVP